MWRLGKHGCLGYKPHQSAACAATQGRTLAVMWALAKQSNFGKATGSQPSMSRAGTSHCHSNAVLVCLQAYGGKSCCQQWPSLLTDQCSRGGGGGLGAQTQPKGRCPLVEGRRSEALFGSSVQREGPGDTPGLGAAAPVQEQVDICKMCLAAQSTQSEKRKFAHGP